MLSDFATAPYFAELLEFDAARYVCRPRRAHLLVQHGRHDQDVTLAEARAMFAAAAEPKTWRKYDCGHGIDGYPPARTDRIRFFKERLLDP